MSYEQAVHFAQTWGVVMLVAGFAVAIAYALWPSNTDQFECAARAPLNDGE